MSRKGRRPPARGLVPPGRAAGAVPSLQQLVQQAAEVQAQVEQQRLELADRTFTAGAGGGVVTAVVRGNGEVESIHIDPSVLDPGDPELVGDLVVAAVNQAFRRLQEAAAGSLGSVGGLDPGGLEMDDLRGLLG